MSRLNNLYLFLNDEKGRTLPRAKLFFYENNSFDFKNTYADKALTSVNPNPVIADGAGRFPNIFLEADTYRVVLQDEDGVEISTKDDVDNLLSDGDLFATSWISSLTTVPQMVAESKLSIGNRVRTSGESASGDGSGADYEIVAGGTGLADGVYLIDLDNGLQARKIDTFPAPSYKSKTQSKVLSNNTESASPFGVKAINIIGDSISHGTGSEDIPNNSWVGIFRKMANIDFGGFNYGFCSLRDDLGGGSTEIHSVTFVGTWDALFSDDGAAFMSGRAYRNTADGDAVDIVVPSNFDKVRVWFNGGTTGIIDVSVDGVSVATIDTSAFPAGQQLSNAYLLTDNGLGETEITLTVTTGLAEISGVGYYVGTIDSPEDQFQINNFSDAGRQTIKVGEGVVEKACQGCHALIWALGTNDRFITEASPEAADLNQVLDWVVEYANANNTKVYFLELTFGVDVLSGFGSYVRQVIRSAAARIPSSEIVSPVDMFSIDGSAASSTSLQASGFLSDAVHPSPLGHRVIAECISTKMGLSVNSKALAEITEGAFQALQLPVTDFANLSTVPNAVTGYTVNGRSVEVKLRLSVSNLSNGQLIGTIPHKVASNTTSLVPIGSAGVLGINFFQSGTSTTVTMNTNTSVFGSIAANISFSACLSFPLSNSYAVFE